MSTNKIKFYNNISLTHSARHNLGLHQGDVRQKSMILFTLQYMSIYYILF